MNHLEQLVGEWYEYNGYFVRRNVLVGRRPRGGWQCELDVVAFNPSSAHLVHLEPSLDADSWARRRERFSRKFEAGRKYIPELFAGIDLPAEIEQIAIFVFASKSNVESLGSGRVALASDLYAEIVRGVKGKRVARSAVPEQFPLVRTIQYCCEYESQIFGNKAESEQTITFVRGTAT